MVGVAHGRISEISQMHTSGLRKFFIPIYLLWIGRESTAAGVD